VYVGPRPLELAQPVTGDPPANVLSAALAAVCGGLLAQAALGQLGAIITGPSVLTSWIEEHLWVAWPGIGAHARSVISEGVPWPALGGILERMSPGVAQRFGVLVAGQPAEPLVTTVVDDDAVVVMVRRDAACAERAAVRPVRADPPAVEPLLWSPLDGPSLEGARVTGDGIEVPDGLPPSAVVVCGAGALGSWASAVLAASRIADLGLCVVDMDNTIETHNLNRQVLFSEADVGLPKAARAAQRLAAIDPGLSVHALQVMIAPGSIDELTADDPAGLDGYEIVDLALKRERSGYQASLEALAGALREADAILSCPDNHQTRWTLNVISERLGIALVNGAVEGFTGRVHVCDPADHAQCLVCWLGWSIADDPRRLSCTDRVGTAPVAAVVTSAAVVGAAQAAALIADLAGLGQKVRRYHVFEGGAGTLAGYRGADRDPAECPAHLVPFAAVPEDVGGGSLWPLALLIFG
jgi:adenylyltransferase/sulfurtransferase